MSSTTMSANDIVSLRFRTYAPVYPAEPSQRVIRAGAQPTKAFAQRQQRPSPTLSTSIYWNSRI